MATASEAVRRLTVEATTRGVKEAAAATRDLGTAVDGVAVSSQRAERATQSMESRLTSIQRKYDATYRAQMEQARVERDLAAAQAQGLITLQRRLELQSMAAERHGLATAAVARETAAIQQQTAAVNRLGAANDNAWRRRNMMMQLFDVGQMLALGQNPAMTALQQGPQIAQMYSGGQGGVKAALQDTLALLGPIATRFGPIAAAAGVAALAIKGIQTEAQKGTDAVVSFGDTAKAVFQVVARAIQDFIKPAVDLIAPWFNAAWDAIAEAARAQFNLTVRIVATAVESIKYAWDALPSAFLVTAAAAAQGFIDTIVWMARESVVIINGLLTDINGLARKVGLGDVVPLLPSPMELIPQDMVPDVADLIGATDALEALKKRTEEYGKSLGDIAERDYFGDLKKAITDQAIKNAQDRLNESIKAQVKAEQDRIAELKLQIDLVGKTAGEVARLTTEFESLAAAKAAAAEAGRSLTQGEVERIRAYAAEVGKLTEKLAATKAIDDLLFDQAQKFRSPIDQKVFAELRSIGVDIASQDGQRIADLIRQNEAIDQQKSLFGDIGQILKGIAEQFAQSEMTFWDFVDALVAGIGQIGDKLMATFGDGGLFGKMMGGQNGVTPATLAAQVAQSVPATYIGSPAHGARGASELQISAASSLARASDSLSGVTASYRAAIARIESGGRYDEIGPTHPTLGRALGKYQVMEANVGPWSQQALGQSVSAAEFLRNPAVQDAVFDHVFGGYVKRFGLEGAAQAWFAGPGGVGKVGRTDVLGTSVGKYGQMFVSQLAANDNTVTGSVTSLPATAPIPATAPAAGLGTSSGSGGTFQKFAGAAGALASGFASGYNTQNPLMGAITGGLGALGSGDPLAIGLGILGGFIGGIIGLKKAIDEARAELDKLRPEMETFFKVGAGEGVSSMAESLRQYTDQAKEYAKIADKARDFETLDKLREAVVAFEETLKGDFRLGFEATIASLSSGQGLDGELVQAQAAVLSLREELKAFKADADFVYGAGSEASARASIAGQQQLLATIGGAAAQLSDIAFEMERLHTILPSVQSSLGDLGMDGVAAAKAIRERLITAVTDLRKTFEDDLTASLNELTGRGYLNQIADAQDRYNQRLADAAELGLDAAGAQEELALTLFAIMRNAGATTDELQAFGQSFDGVRASLRDFLRQAVESAASTLRQTLEVWRDFVDGIAEYRSGLNLNPSLSTLSPAGRLEAARSAFEATAAGARAGDRDAMGRLQSDASAYLEQAASFWSSTEQYADIFNQVQATLLDVETNAANQISLAEQQLTYAEQNVAGLTAANDNLMTLVQSSEALRAAVDAYLGAGGTLPSSISDLAQAALAAAVSSTAVASKTVSDVVDYFANRGVTDTSGIIGPDTALFYGNPLSPFGLGGGTSKSAADVQLGTENKGFFQRVGDWFADLLGFANGGAFVNGMPVTAFASGGMVSQPTLFPMANGMGLMGEAGPEAIMPLRRDGSGRLGVSAAGNDNGPALANLARVTAQSGNAIVAELRSVRDEVAGLKSENAELRREVARQGGMRPRATGTNG